MSDNIKVVVKVRPLIPREIEDKLSYQWRVKNNTLYQLDQNGKDFGSCFTFDKVYDKETKTCDIYDDIAKPIVEAATAGFNGTIFAYGQTSSGKTYTMTGTDDSPGIIPLAVHNLFQIIKNIPGRDFLVRVSYIEIYNETLKDLLNDKKVVKEHETFQGVKVDCTEQVTTSPDEVLKYLKEGEANRQTGATNMNEESSRSHSIFQITIESREHIEGEEEVGCVNVSQLNLVDLAGSERAGQTGATGIRFKEGTHINKSLSALALVIKQLSENQTKHVNYRDSKLTRILQNSLGGNAKTSIICAITPAAVEETISTLQFANRAKAIKNKPEVNAVATDATMIQSLTKQLSRLQSQLESKKNLEVMLESKKTVEHNLQKQIAALQRLILNGFGTRSSIDMMASRRKLVQPRRVTISTLHPIDEDPVPSVPKFHTPLLKYNPMMMPGSNDFVPIQNAKLSSLPEEGDIRLITPPPPDKKVNFNDEIIDLDSDDDGNSLHDVQTCSPYHKCYGSSKTPPCVLRKNAKLAEKNLKDIVELTEREKIYTPTVVELIEKLEQNTTVITRLEEEVIALNRRSKDKELEIDQLKAKVSKSNEEIKLVTSAKEELEAQCKEYTTKLTDWEVSYDTLKSKTKRREDELLSLLDEQKKHKQVEETSKLLMKNLEKEINFMDMSKDISLVNSDNESSMTNLNDDESAAQVQDLVKDMQSDLSSKNKVVLELEEDLMSQKQKILTLENSSHELQRVIDELKDKVDLLENENTLLKSTVETLNSTIKTQKSNLELANNDIESYNNLIQELQIKLTNKENITNLSINENVLEKMIANEEKFIANNENIKNIITCLKLSLESRNKELEALKSTAETNCSDHDALREKLTQKDKEINDLSQKAKELQDKVDNDITLIDKIIQENNTLKNLEHQLNSELANITKQLNQLEVCNEEKDSQIVILKDNNEKLTQSLAERENVEGLNKKILQLEDDIRVKDNLINHLNTQDTLNQENLFNAKSVLATSRGIIAKFNDNVQDPPQSIEDMNDILDSLKNNLNHLESMMLEIVTQKDTEIENCRKLINNLETSNKNLELAVANLQVNEEEFNKTVQDLMTSKEELNKICCERDNLLKDLESKSEEVTVLKSNISNIEEKCDSFSAENSFKETIITSLKEKEQSLSAEIEKLKQEKLEAINDSQQQINNLTENYKLKEKEIILTLEEKVNAIDDLNKRITQIEKHNHSKSAEAEKSLSEANTAIKDINSLLDDILQQAIKGLRAFNIDYCADGNISTHKNIIIVLNETLSYIQSKAANDSMDKELLICKETMSKLGDENHKLSNTVNELDTVNTSLLSQLEEIKSENRSLTETLKKSHEILEDLKLELNEKVNELNNMVTKTEELKENFSDFDLVMKEQVKGLQADNEKLLARCTELEINLMESCNSDMSIGQIKDKDVSSQEKVVTKSYAGEDDNMKTIETISPPSLLTICCNKIVDTIGPSESSVTPTDSNASIDVPHSLKCECEILRKELRSAQVENLNISNALHRLEAINQELISEREQVKQEVQLLLEPAYELQKKINSHKTNLSTLTATTYAENKSLKSQVKVLQHHHNRFHNVCQRDLPVVKQQLKELMTILKGEQLFRHNESFKRYSLPSVLLDNNSTLNHLKNESTLDGDLLMLDTNVTMTTSADNTLMGLDQTCLDMTQAYINTDVGCQTCDTTYLNVMQSQVELFSESNVKMYEKMQALENENQHLREQLSNNPILPKECIDAQTSPFKKSSDTIEALVCKECEELKQKAHSFEEQISLLSEKCNTVLSQREDIQRKYDNLALEIPSTDALLKRISIFEKELKGRVQEIAKLSNQLSRKTEEIKQLQQENDALSTQVMENISETDDLNKELEIVRDSYEKLSAKCCNLEKELEETRNAVDGKVNNCSHCHSNDDVINTLQNSEYHTKFNRSLSDSGTSTRLNKICTLQNELHAGREDCKELSEDVTVIKKHLERSNLSMGQSMDLDESMGEPNIFSISKHFDNVGNQLNKFAIPNSTQGLDVYSVDKIDCINYYVEKTGADKENLDFNIRIVDVMKMFYSNCIMKHQNEVENLVNKIKCFEESRNQLEICVKELSSEYEIVTKKLEEKDNNFLIVNNSLTQIKENIAFINEEVSHNSEADKNAKFFAIFKEKFLSILDQEFGFASITLFDKLVQGLISKHEKELNNITNNYTELQADMDIVNAELSAVNSNLLKLKSDLTDKENECNLLKAQKDKVQEISNAVTLDIIKKEQELCQTIMNGYKKLAENNMICSSDVDLKLPLNSIDFIFDNIIKEFKNQNTDVEKEKEILTLEIKKSKTELEENQKALETLKLENDKLKEINRSVTLDLIGKDNKLQAQDLAYEELSTKCVSSDEKIKSYSALIDQKDNEIQALKENLLEKENALQNVKGNENSFELLGKESKLAELLDTVSSCKEEIASLKAINDVINKEKDATSLELEKCKELLRKNTIELDKMTSDILVLRESVKDNVSMIETLKLEAKSLLQQNVLMKEQFEEKCRDCSRLEMNIKTHEKTAEIQSKMIMRHQKQKEEDDKAILEKNKQLEELNRRITDLQNDSENMKSIMKATRDELDKIKSVKEDLEVKLSQMEIEFDKNKPRLSIDAAADTTRRRRQSIYDANRVFADNQDTDHTKMEAVFESRSKPVDFFMDVDEDHSNRSTPLRNSKGRDSLLSRHEQSDEATSRPSSVAETRRRRQSTHDLRRSGVQQTPSPHERTASKINELTSRKSTDADNNEHSEVSQLREKLSACQQELEDLKEQYRELDEECETCAQYLQERDEQCRRLKVEKDALEKVVSELKDKQSANLSRSQQEPKPNLCHVAVNTDEDWANLHSIVVDRMSFDAEVEKNKRLTKIIEDLRFKKQDLKLTVAKMQKALEKGATKDFSKELEMTKNDLKACKQELKELREKYAELDEECETCSTYLQERDEQVRKLKEAKAALEAKLQEYDKGSTVSLSLRKKRQSLHDRQRAPPGDLVDAATQVSDEFLNNQVERDSDPKKSNDDKAKEIKYLKLAVERLTQQKAALQQQLPATAPGPLFVATGSAIVQNQQLTDVMKENQKLKKINAKLIDICKKRGKKPDVTGEVSEQSLPQ